MNGEARRLAENEKTPVLILDLAKVRSQYDMFTALFPSSTVYFAIKANPHAKVLQTLRACGSSFDCASREEIEACLSQNIPPQCISFGSTIKKSESIAFAHKMGIELFAVDSPEETLKVSRHAPGSRVYCRIAHDGQGSAWPLGLKFGCTPAEGLEILGMAKRLGLKPIGISFHVGSQQVEAEAWRRAIRVGAQLFKEADSLHLALSTLNIGGGFPIPLREPAPGLDGIAEAIHSELALRFGGSRPNLLAEPGRFLVGEAGCIVSEVVLRTARAQARNWIYLDIGKFGGLAETMGESIQYKIQPLNESQSPLEEVILAGPSCDSADILYEKSKYLLPKDLKPGSRVVIFGTGAYTSTYSSNGFNGFGPLQSIFIS